MTIALNTKDEKSKSGTRWKWNKTAKKQILVPQPYIYYFVNHSFQWLGKSMSYFMVFFLYVKKKSNWGLAILYTQNTKCTSAPEFFVDVIVKEQTQLAIV